METFIKVIVVIVLSALVVFLIAVAGAICVEKIEDMQKQKKLKKDKKKDKEKDKIEKLEKLEKRISYLEFCKRVPTGVELKIVRSANLHMMIKIKRLAIFEYGAEIHEVCYKECEDFYNVEDVKELTEIARKDKIYENTPETLIIFNEEEGYTKIEKYSGKVMDVTDIINLKGGGE